MGAETVHGLSLLCQGPRRMETLQGPNVGAFNRAEAAQIASRQCNHARNGCAALSNSAHRKGQGLYIDNTKVSMFLLLYDVSALGDTTV